MGQTSINYVRFTLNPWIGCMKISCGCDHCFAELTADIRYGRVEWGGERKQTTPAIRVAPFKWNRLAVTAGERYRVLTMSWGDYFDNAVPEEWRTETWTTIKLCRNLDFLLLTKRPQNILRFLPPRWGAGWQQCWVGVSVENQLEADRRVPLLLAVPAYLRWLSVEPMLSAIDLRKWLATGLIGFVVIGGESGPGFRPMELAWARDVLAQCHEYGVPVFMKQMAALHPKDADIPADLLIREFPT